MKLTPRMHAALVVIASTSPTPYVLSGWIDKEHVHAGLNCATVRALTDRGLINVRSLWRGNDESVTIAWLTTEGAIAL